MQGLDFPRPADRYEDLVELRRRPLVAVLDTSCVRTGLAHQLKSGLPPASLSTVQDGMTRLFMERETLEETCEKLPAFAAQLGVSTSDLVRRFAEDWLPYIRVVDLPTQFRELDTRAVAVHALDSDDYPTAALAALLSPCVLLTHNYKHFGPLGVREPQQGVNAVIAAIDLKMGETRLQAVATIPAAPLFTVGAGAKWAAGRFGPVVWLIVGLLIIGGIVTYRLQPPERREAIKRVAGEAGRFLIEESSEAASAVDRAGQLLGTYAVPAPDRRTPTATVLRELALAPGSMSAQQLYDRLEAGGRPTVSALRAFLHANKEGVFGKPDPGASSWGSAFGPAHSTARQLASQGDASIQDPGSASGIGGPRSGYHSCRGPRGRSV